MTQEAATSCTEGLLTSPVAQDAKGHSVLTSYTDIRECTSPDKENPMNEPASTQCSLDPASHQHVSESVLDGVALSSNRQTVPELQSTMEQTMSLVHDHISGDTAILGSTPATPYSVSEDASDAAVVDNIHSSSSHLDTDQSACISYDHVSESSAQLSGSLLPTGTEIASTLPSFTEISEGASSISENIANHKLEMNSASDEGTLENNSELLRKSSLQANQTVTSDECVHHTYLETPDGTSSAEEKTVTDNSSEQILTSCQRTCNPQALADFPKVFEDATELPEAQSELQPGKEPTLTSFSADNIPHVSVDASVPLQSVSDLPHSMPLLMDEPLTETSNDCTQPDQALKTKSHLREDDTEIENILEQSER
jgi:hypothetical protein